MSSPPIFYISVSAQGKVVMFPKPELCRRHGVPSAAPSTSPKETPMRIATLSIILLSLPALLAAADHPAPRDTSAGDRMIAEYFQQETARLADR